MGEVDVGSSQRVEIELEEQQPKRSRLRHRDARRSIVPDPPAAIPSDAVFTPAGEPPEPAGAGERRRLVATGLAVGAVALFLGWALGRAGGDGDGAAATTGTAATQTTVAATTVPSTVAPEDTLPEAELPATTRPRPSTTTTLPPAWEEGRLSIDARLAGQADRIVAVTDTGGLVEIAVGTGATRSLASTRPSSSTPVPPVAGRDWIAISFDDGNAPLVLTGDDPIPQRISSGDFWSSFWDPAGDSYWQMQWSPDGTGPIGVEQFSVTGQPTGVALDTGGLWASGADPLGGVVVGNGGIGAVQRGARWHEPTPDRRPADHDEQRPPPHVRVRGELESCGISIVDRATGEARSVPTDPVIVASLFSSGWWWGAPAAVPLINADGDRIRCSRFRVPTGLLRSA